jgi:hypothetical protein
MCTHRCKLSEEIDMMREDTARILNEWASVLEFNPDQRSFDLGNFSLDIHIAGETMKKLINQFDDSGEISVLYAKQFYMDYLKHVSIKLFDLFQDDSDDLKIFRNLYRTMNGVEVESIEQKWFIAVYRILKKLGIYLIADEFDTSVLYDAVECITKDVTRCNIDVFGKGAKSKNNEPFIYGTTIRSFNTMAECILDLSSSSNGIYLCYISLNNKPDGYFTYIYKCENTLVSINDRVNESFRGQHNKSRNNRWMEYKCYNLFPYDIIEYGDGRDYKGYATSMKISEDAELSLTAQGVDAAKIIITMMMIENFVKYKMDFDDYELSYSDVMLPANRPALFQSNDTEIMMLNKNEVVQYHDSVDFNISREDVMCGLDDDDPIVLKDKYSDFKYSKESSESVKDLFPEFKFNESNILAIRDENQAEFIGTYSKMREQAYMDARKEFAAYCRKQIASKYLEVGGMKFFRDWFNVAVRVHVNDVKNAAVRKYVSGTRNGFDCCSQVVDSDFMYSIRVDFDDTYLGPTSYIYLCNREYRGNGYKYICPITGNTANVWIKFKIRSANDLRELLGTDDCIPELLRLFKSDRDYHTNNLLSSHDELAVVGAPIEDRMWSSDEMQEVREKLGEPYHMNHNLECCIGFSKRGLNKLIKDSSIVIRYNEEGNIVIDDNKED